MRSRAASPQPSSSLAPDPGSSISGPMAPVSSPGSGGAPAPYAMPAHQISDGPGDQSGWMNPVANPLALALAQTGGGLGGLGGMPLPSAPTAPAPATAPGGRYLSPAQADPARFNPPVPPPGTRGVNAGGGNANYGGY